jgi:hypothetical protein
MSSKDASEFKQQLHEAELQAAQLTCDYPSLPLDQQRDCMVKLEQTLKLLSKIREDLADAEKRESGVFTVQVLGLNSVWEVKASDFVSSFSRNTAIVPTGLTLTMENNYMHQGTGKTLGAVEEWFITFEHEKDACCALGLGKLQLGSARIACTVKFVQPSATRATFRKIGPLVERMRAIGEELKAMGAVWDDGMYKFDSSKYLDTSWFVGRFVEMKRVREAGQSLDRHTYAPLKYRKPLDTAKFQAQTKKLYDEECDCLIALREFQANGLDFDF